MSTLLRACILLLLSGVIPVQAQEQAPDLILSNGKVITVDDQFSIAQALAISNDRIRAVGSNAETLGLAGPNTDIIDLDGRTVIPGLIDTHSHVIRASQLWLYEVRLDGVTSRQEAVSRLRERAAQLEAGEWLFNLGGWVEEQFLDDPRGFTLDELDAIAPDNPVYLDVNYNHRYVNSAFLELAGIPLINKDASEAGELSGGLFSQASGHTEAMIERDENGRATGKIVGGPAAWVQAVPLFPVLEGETAIESLKMVVQESVSHGLTAVYDGGGFGIQRASYDRARMLAERGELNLRVYNSHFITARTPDEAAETVEKLSDFRAFQGDDMYDVLGIGEAVFVPVLDGFGGAAADTPENRAGLRTMLKAAASRGWHVNQHAVNPATMAMTLDIMDELSAEYSLPPLRWVFIHADLIDRPTLDRMRAYNMVPSLRTHFMLGSVRRAQTTDLFGEAQAMSIPPFRMVQDTGVPWAFGSEAPRINVLNPLMSLAFVVTGKRFYDLEPVLNSTISREEALIAHTRHGALALFKDNSLGQISPGYLADLVVLDRDYLTVPEDELFDIQAVMTFVGGRLVHAADNTPQGEQ